MTGRLTTHVLDTANGRPGAGINVDLYRVENNRSLVASAVTNADGRCDAPLLEGENFRTGEYELDFHAGEYFDRNGVGGPVFLDHVVIRFRIAARDENYHVPLLLSPFGYTTYRGS